jgi:hypothetical protein
MCCLVNNVGAYLHNAAIRQKNCTIQGSRGRGNVLQRKQTAFLSTRQPFEIRSNKILKHKFFVDQTLLIETFSTSFWSSAYISETFWLPLMIIFFTPYADIFHDQNDNPRIHFQ